MKQYFEPTTHCFIHILFYPVFFKISALTIMGHHLCRPSGSMTNMNQQHLIKDDLDAPYLVQPANQKPVPTHVCSLSIRL